ncbi:MAG: hypothetical protein ACRYGP_18310 [Janthinobacterium lividum]
MTPADLTRSARDASEPPVGLSAPVRALWWDRKGDWPRAHEAVAADEDGRDAAWVHAYLHRREGDLGNARYWYGRAGRPVSSASLDAEWENIVAALLGA